MDDKISNVIASIYALTGLHMFTVSKQQEDIDLPFQELPIADMIKHMPKDDVHRVLLDEQSNIYLYALCTSSCYVFFGPAAHHELTYFEVHAYKKKFPNTVGFLATCSEHALCAAISLTSSILHETEIPISYLATRFTEWKQPLDTERTLVTHPLEIQDTFQLNHSSEHEKAFLNLVLTGNVKGIQDLIDHTTILFPTPVKNHIKNHEYMIVSLITLLSRTAIKGNVPYNIALAQSDAYLKLISECTSKEEFTNIAHDAAIKFTRLVAQNQNVGAYSLVSIQCKKLVHANILNSISLSSLASSLSVSKEYLATCFKKDYDLTVTQYIHKKKMEYACQLLMNANYSIHEIANRLCYNSTSYFIKVFKDTIGITPTEFKKQNLAL